MLVAAFGSIGSFVEGTMTTKFFFYGDPDSKHADELLEQRLDRVDDVNEVVIVRSASLTVDDTAYREHVLEISAKIAALGIDSVANVVSFYGTGDESLVSADRHTTILPVIMAGEFKVAEANVVSVHEIVDETNGVEGFEVFITGESTISTDWVEGNQRDAEKGEMFGAPIALIILAVVSGALAAAVLPMLMAIISIMVAFGLVLVVGQAIQVQQFAQNLVTMIGLAVGIDYSLFIVSRFREELARGLPKLDAIALTGRTASRAVLFSGMTVVIAVIGILVVPDRVYFSVGLGMILVVTTAVVASLTLLPAILSLMGDGVNRFRVPLVSSKHPRPVDSASGFWNWITTAVMRRPLISLVLTAGLLLAVAVQYFDINTGTSGVSQLPDDFRAKKGFEVLREEFGFGLNAPVEIVIDGDINSDLVQGAIQGLTDTLKSNSSFGPSSF